MFEINNVTKLETLVAVAIEEPNRGALLEKTTKNSVFRVDRLALRYRKKTGRLAITVHICHYSSSGIALHSM